MRFLRLALFALLLAPSTASAQGRSYFDSLIAVSRREPLVGLGMTIPVVLEGIDEQGRDAGLSQQAIKNQVELRLRQASISVAAESFGLEHFLYVVVTLAGTRANYAANVSVQFQDYVEVSNGTTTFVTTWDSGKVLLGGAPPNGRVRSALDELLDEFLNDWLAANPSE